MKKTFSNWILDWILIGISLLFSVLAVWKLTNGIDIISSYLLRIVIALVSISAVLGLLVTKFNGERFFRFFVLVVLIFPPILVIYEFITDLVFYGITRMNLLENPFLYLKLISGIILFYLTLVYSKQPITERKKDYGILIIGIGVFIICYVLTRTIEPNFNSEFNNYPVWKTIVKISFGIAILFIGTGIKNQKLKFNKVLILTLILMFILGLI